MNINQLEEQLKQIEKTHKQTLWEEQFKKALKEYHGEDEVISFQDYKKYLAEKKEPELSIKTKIPKLDRITDGFNEGNLVIITGPTGCGKTTLAQTFTKNFNVKSLWFTYEVSPSQFLAKYGEDMPVGYLPKTLISNKLVWIERKIVEAIAKYGTKAVFIDHLHYILDFGKMKNPSLEIGNIVRQIKLLAQKYNIAIFLLAHITKTKFDDRIGIEDLRDSSFIAQESDFVLIIYRETEQKNKIFNRKEIKYIDEAKLLIEKNRKNGRLGSISLNHKNNLFYEKISLSELSNSVSGTSNLSFKNTKQDKR